MSRKWAVIATVVAVVVAFAAGTWLYRERTQQQASAALQSHSDALVRPHAPIFGNAAAKVTIVEFFDPSCETCRAFYPVVKGFVNASFGQVRLVVRYAPLHKGSDRAVKILEAARVQGKYWEAVEKALAAQPQWADHHDPQPELLWALMGELGLDLAKARADADSPALDALLRQDVADMQALQVRATPGFFVNGRPLRDFGAPQLKALIDEELQKVAAP